MTAREAGDQSIAFCCISTGIFGFPATEAARIATRTMANLQAGDAAADRTLSSTSSWSRTWHSTGTCWAVAQEGNCTIYLQLIAVQ